MDVVTLTLIENLRKGYEDRLTELGRSLQNQVDKLQTDPVLLQLARDCDSAIHISVHIEDLIRGILKREQEHTTQKSIQAEASARANRTIAELTITQLKQENAQASHKISNLEQQLQQQREQLTKMTVSVPKASSNEVAEQVKELEQLKQHNQTIINKAFLQSKTQEDNIARMNNKHSQDQTELSILKSEKQQLASKYKQLAAKLQKIIKQKSAADEQMKNNLQAVASQNQILTSANNQLTKDVNQREQITSELEAELTLQKQIIAQLQSQHKHELTTRDKKDAETNQSFRSQIADIRASLAEKDRLIQEYHLKEAVDSKMKELIHITEQQKQHQQQQQQQQPPPYVDYARCEYLQEQLTTSKNQCEALEKKSNGLSTQLEAVTEQSKADLVQMSEHLKNTSDKLRECESDRQALAVKNTELVKSVEIAEAKLLQSEETAKLKEEATSLRIQLQNQQSDPSKETINELKIELATYKQKLNNQNMEKEGLLQVKNAAEQHLEQLQSRCKQIEEELAVRTHEVNRLQAMLKVMETALSEEKETRIDVEKQLQTLISDKESSDCVITAEQRVWEAEHSELIELRAMKTVHQNNERRLKEADAHLLEVQTELQATRADLTKHLKRAKYSDSSEQEITALKLRLDEQNSLINDMSEEVTTLRKQRSAAEQNLSALQKEIDDDSSQRDDEQRALQKLNEAHQRDTDRLKGRLAEEKIKTSELEQQISELNSQIMEYKKADSVNLTSAAKETLVNDIRERVLKDLHSDIGSDTTVSEPDLALRRDLESLRRRFSNQQSLYTTSPTEFTNISPPPGTASSVASSSRRMSRNTSTSSLKGAFIR